MACFFGITLTLIAIRKNNASGSHVSCAGAASASPARDLRILEIAAKKCAAAAQVAVKAAKIAVETVYKSAKNV